MPTRDVCLSRSVVLGRGLLGSYGLKTLKGNRISGGRTLNSGREEEGEGQGERQAGEEAGNGGREGGRGSQSSCSVGRGIASLSNSTMKQKKATDGRMSVCSCSLSFQVPGLAITGNLTACITCWSIWKQKRNQSQTTLLLLTSKGF